MIKLYVKGDRYQAARAAADRGVPFAFIREVRREGAIPITIGLSNVEAEILNRWFVSDMGELMIGDGYPIGSLLLWSESETEESEGA